MNDPGVGLFARRSDRLDRWIQFGMAGGKVIKVDFPLDRPAEAASEHTVLDRLGHYLDDGTEDDFRDIDIALTGPTDYRPVYDAVREIPYGTQANVETIAERALGSNEDDAAIGTVREALRANPVPVLVPDHRIQDVTGSTPTAVREVLRSIEGLS